MQFTTALFALAAAAVTNAQEPYGKWNVTISQYAIDFGYQSQTVLADFYNDGYYQGKNVIHTVCKYEYDPRKNPRETKSCVPDTFSYEYDGITVNVSQVIEHPKKMTVFGDAPLDLKNDGTIDGAYKGNVFIDADRASA